ncbi:unnamed protein product [Ixodes pacificus]
MVKCEVNGQELIFLVDTGSKVTLIRERDFSAVREEGNTEPLLAGTEKMMRFVGITGNQLGVSGRYLLKFQLGNQSFDHACYVCSDGVSLPETVSGIMGQDLLRSQGVDFILSENHLRLKDDTVPILTNQTKAALGKDASLKHEERGENCHLAVYARVTENTIVPPMSEQICVCVLSSDVEVGAVGVLEPEDSLSNGLKAAGCLVSVGENSEVPIRVVNFTQGPLSLPRNKVVATFTTAIEDPVESVCVTQDVAGGKTSGGFSSICLI